MISLCNEAVRELLNSTPRRQRLGRPQQIFEIGLIGQATKRAERHAVRRGNELVATIHNFKTRVVHVSYASGSAG